MQDSKPVTTLIVDDEPIARAGLRAMLEATEWIHVVGEATNGPEATASIDRLRPELVFLDVAMPGFDGIEVARRIAHTPCVIFTTAWAQHAATAFELGALDYLLKPFGPERLALALERARLSLGEPATVSPLERFREARGDTPITRIFVRSGRAIIPVAVESVRWFEADGDYVALHLLKGKQLVHLSLSRLEARLDAERFVRIHRNAIVNLDCVKAFRSVAKGNVVAELDDGTRLEVSRNRAKELRGLGY